VLLNIYDNSEFRRVTILTRFVHFLCLWFETGPFVVVSVVGLVILFVVAPFSLLAVFQQASAFNQDVSKWNTGAVTTMQESKCTLSLPLLWRLPLWCGVEYTCMRQLEIHRITILTFSHVLFFPSFSKCSTTVASHEHSAVAHGNP